MIALVEAWKAGLFSPKYWVSNIVSGVIVGLVSLPLGIAFAIASGARPEQGLYTGIIAGLLVSIFGGSRYQIAGATGAFVAILSGITLEYGIDGLQIATFMAGIIMILFGLARFGAVLKFIPDPVIVGFTAGIGVLVFIGQMQNFFGLPEIVGERLHQKLWHIFERLPDFHGATTVLSLLGLILILLLPKINYFKKIPGPILAVLGITLLQSYFDFEGVATIGGTYGAIPSGLPEFQLPHFNHPKLVDLIGPAFTIAMLGSIESLLSAAVADDMTGSKHNSNQELIGQGIANAVVPFFGGFAATGAIARSATSIRNGATSPLAGIVCALVMASLVLFAADYASHIPLCALAAVLFVVAYHLSDFRHFFNILKRAPRSDSVIMVATFLLTVFVDLVVAVNVGVILATLDFMRRMSLSVDVFKHLPKAKGGRRTRAVPQVVSDDIVTYSIEGPFFFGVVERFEQALVHTHTEPKFVILRLGHVPFADMTAIQTLEEVIINFSKREVQVILCEINAKLKAQFQKAGILNLVPPENVFVYFREAYTSCLKRLSEP